jgi:hypothetical protein
MEGLRAIDPNCPKKSSFAGFGLWVQFEFQNWFGGADSHVWIALNYGPLGAWFDGLRRGMMRHSNI